MAEIVPVKPKTFDRKRALEIVERYRAKHADAANDIALITAAAVEKAVGSCAPYSSHGAILATELEIHHRDADGSETVARMKFRYGRDA